MKGQFVRLHLYLGVGELCIKYKDAPYLQKLPTGTMDLVTRRESSEVQAVSKENYVLSIALEAETHRISLEEKKGTEYPITLYYIHSTPEKLNNNPFIILRFNCSSTDLFLGQQQENLVLKVTLNSVDSDEHYQGTIPVRFKVCIALVK